MNQTAKAKRYWIGIAGSVLLSVVLFVIIVNPFKTSSSPNILTVNDSGISAVQDERLNINEILSRKNEIMSVATKYSALYGSGLNRHMYVFAVPVRESVDNNYTLFDNSIYNNEDGTFQTRNKAFNIAFNESSVDLHYELYDFSILLDDSTFPEKKDIFVNLYGDSRESVKYSGMAGNMDISFIPTCNGVLMELEIPNKIEQNELKLEINTGRFTYINDPAGYIQILNGDAKVGMIYQGIIVDSNNSISVNNNVKLKKKDKETKYLTIDSSQFPQDISYPAKIYISIDFYSEKMFFDTSVYESMPKVNTLLNNVSRFDAINEGHDGYTYMKYNIRSFTPKYSSMLDSLTLNLYAMAVIGSIDIEVYKVDKDWCSWTITWDGKPDYYEKVGEITITETGWYAIDLKDYAKKLIENGYDDLLDNSIVLKVKDGSRGYALMASADNTYAPPFFEVKYRMERQAN